jgi:hypothetical protein
VLAEAWGAPYRARVVGFVRLRIAAPLAALFLGLGGCTTHAYRVEQREVPVHVWITAPEVAARGGSLPALVYVGPQKVVEGRVTFEASKPTVALPNAYVRAGPTPVSVVLGDGAMAVHQTVEVDGEAWLQVMVRGNVATLRQSKDQPDPRGR